MADNILLLGGFNFIKKAEEKKHAKLPCIQRVKRNMADHQLSKRYQKICSKQQNLLLFNHFPASQELYRLLSYQFMIFGRDFPTFLKFWIWDQGPVEFGKKSI